MPNNVQTDTRDPVLQWSTSKENKQITRKTTQGLRNVEKEGSS